MTRASGQGDSTNSSQRIDRFLWYARLAHDRPAAQALAERAVMRLNGRRIEHAHALVRPGDVVTLPRGTRVLVIRILQLPTRRGPAAEARLLYELILPDAPVSGTISPSIDIDAGPREE